ncbi:MAG: NAD-binding protein [Acidimicrobiia bacterium]
MLKSLGATMAQITQRLSGGERTLSLDASERATAVAQRAQRRRRNRTLLVILAVFVVIVTIFSAAFHQLMELEGRTYSWPTSVYWTLTTMSTLGFGDITFESDAGRIFSIVVLLAGSTSLLVMLPFLFIQFVFMPWMAERERRRAPRSVPASTSGHLLLTAWGPVEAALVERAERAAVPYVLIVEDMEEAGRLHDEGRRVMVGHLDDPATYRSARVEQAKMVVATRDDQANTNIAFTVREIAPEVDIVATANSPDSVDILEIAGAGQVVQLGEILGSAMAARALGLGGRTHVIGRFAGLLIAEAGIVGTELVGHSLNDARLRTELGVGIVGVWERGEFEIATPETVLHPSTILLLAGSKSQLEGFDEKYAVGSDDAHAVIIGGGRVGRAVGRAYADEGISFTILEKLPERLRPDVPYVIGDAADRSMLEEAGIAEAGAVLVTTHDDNMNVYLTRYCRGLRPDARIVSRARLDRNVTTLYRAGADAVLSYAATGSAAIWNHFEGEQTILVAQGLSIFRVPIPRALAGKSLSEAHIRRLTGCNVVGVESGGKITANPDPDRPMPYGSELVLVGTDDSISDFFDRFPARRWRSARR